MRIGLVVSIVVLLAWLAENVAMPGRGLVSAWRASGDEPREIVLVIRRMTFYLDGDPSPNPIVRLRTGERVKLVVRNLDRGVQHDFMIRSLGVATGPLTGPEPASIVFEAPDTPGEHDYICRPHAKMMKGLVKIVRP